MSLPNQTKLMLPLLLYNSLSKTTTSYSYPPITIYTPSISTVSKPTSTFNNADSALSYLTTLVGATSAKNLVKKIKLCKSTGINNVIVEAALGTTTVRAFKRQNVFIYLKKAADGKVTVKAQTVTTNVDVLSQIIKIVKKKKFLRRRKTSVINEWRPLTASELSLIYDKIESSSQTSVNNALKNVKA